MVCAQVGNLMTQYRTDTENKALGIVILSRLLARTAYNDTLCSAIEKAMFKLEDEIEDEFHSVFAVNLYWRHRFTNLLDYWN